MPNVNDGVWTRTGSAADVCDVAIHPGDDISNDRVMILPKYNGAYIATATTTLVKTGAGVLHSITITETAAGAITVYDNTAASGTIKAVLKASLVEGTYNLDIAFATGLTIVTAANSKLTVSCL